MNFEKELLAEYPHLYKSALRRVRNVDIARELVQQTCFFALRYRHTYKPLNGKPFRAWLFTILANAYHDMLRKEARQKRYTTLPAGLEVIDAPQEHALILKQTLAAIENLVAPQREALLLAAYGKEYTEIAEDQGVAVGTVKSRINRAREALA